MAAVLEERVMEKVADRADATVADSEEVNSPVETDVEVEITTTTTLPAVTVAVRTSPQQQQQQCPEPEDRQEEAAEQQQQQQEEEQEEETEEEVVEEEEVQDQGETEEVEEEEEVEIFEDTRQETLQPQRAMEPQQQQQQQGQQQQQQEVVGQPPQSPEAARLEEKLRQFRLEMDNKNGSDGEPLTGTTSMALRLRQLEKQRRRNIIFDEERFEETFLKCLICRDVYDNVGKVPKMLPCHHTFCLECLREMFRVEGEYRQTLTSAFRGMPMAVKIHCPTCREGLITSQEELRRLPSDHTIQELLTFVKDTGRTDVQYCSKHQMQPLNFFCEPCIMPVCCDCTVLDHKESKGHVVVNVEEALKKYTPILAATMEDINEERAQLEEKRLALEDAHAHLNQIQTELSRSIRQTFDRVRETIDERERELFDMSDAQIQRKRATLDTHMKTLTERERALKSQYETLKQSKADRDISLMFTGHKAAVEVLTKKVTVPTDTTKDFSVTFQFNPRKETLVRQELENLGDIEFQS